MNSSVSRQRPTRRFLIAPEFDGILLKAAPARWSLRRSPALAVAGIHPTRRPTNTRRVSGSPPAGVQVPPGIVARSRAKAAGRFFVSCRAETNRRRRLAGYAARGRPTRRSRAVRLAASTGALSAGAVGERRLLVRSRRPRFRSCRANSGSRMMADCGIAVASCRLRLGLGERAIDIGGQGARRSAACRSVTWASTWCWAAIRRVPRIL